MEPIRVRIRNHEYFIRSDEDGDQVLKIAEYVNHKLREVEQDTEGLSEKKTAILAALNIASDYFQLLREQEKQSKDLKKRTQSLIYRVESVMG